MAALGHIQVICPPHGERFRVLPRTDGMHIVYDPCQPLGRQSARGLAFAYVTQAEDLARELALAVLAKSDAAATSPPQ